MRLALLLCLAGAAFAQPRMRPPEGLNCSRNELTSYTGQVKAYGRTDATITMTLATDADTTEKFSLKTPVKMQIEGREFKPEDWKTVESEKGKLRPGVRATVWECKGGDRLVQWQPPRE